METTMHWKDRQSRLDFINNKIGLGNPIKTFFWDKGHPNGPELHTITDTGIIIIRNSKTKKLVTTLIARPGQINRYYINSGELPPKQLMDIAYKHQLESYNYK